MLSTILLTMTTPKTLSLLQKSSMEDYASNNSCPEEELISFGSDVEDVNYNGKQRGINLLELPFTLKKSNTMPTKSIQIDGVGSFKYDIQTRLIESIILELDNQIITAPSYQRFGWSWSLAMQQELIKSMWLGQPIPNVTVNQIEKTKKRQKSLLNYNENEDEELIEDENVEEEDDNWKEEYQVIDGRHRLITIYNFFNNGFSVLMKNPKTGERETLFFRDFSKKQQARFKHLKICFYVLDNWSEEECRTYFLRLNSGAPLKPSERLNALNNPVLEFIRSLEIITDIIESMKKLKMLRYSEDKVSANNIIIKGCSASGLLFDDDVVGVHNIGTIMDKCVSLGELSALKKEKIRILITAFSKILKQLSNMKGITCKLSEAEIYCLFHFIKTILEKEKSFEKSLKKFNWSHVGRFYANMITINKPKKMRENVKNTLVKNYLSFLTERQNNKQRIIKMRDELLKLYQEEKENSFSEEIVKRKKKTKPTPPRKNKKVKLVVEDDSESDVY